MRVNAVRLLITIFFLLTALSPALPASEALIECASVEMRPRFCPTPVSGAVRLQQQLSESPCVEGQSWGYNGEGVWVKHGCRARFAVIEPHQSNSIVCSSVEGKYRYCGIYTGGYARLAEQFSKRSCIEGQSWGFDGHGVWVDQGCRARFLVGSDYSAQPHAPPYGTYWQGDDYYPRRQDRGGGFFGGYQDHANVPGWAVGAFRAFSKRSGQYIYLMIDPDGAVISNANGRETKGVVNGNHLSIGGLHYVIEQFGSGFRATDTARSRYGYLFHRYR